jgi:hypothetical protein
VPGVLRRWSLAGLAVHAVAVAGGACGSETGVPHPDPLPDVTRMRSSGLMVDRPGAILLVGLAGAVAGQGTVTVETLGASVSAPSTSQGSFIFPAIATRAGELLAIRYQSSPAALKKVATIGIQSSRPPGPIPGVPPVTDLGGGRVRVQGRSIVEGPGIPILGVNGRSGEVVTTMTTTGGDFALELGAATGDTLELYHDEDPLGPAWMLTIP